MALPLWARDIVSQARKDYPGRIPKTIFIRTYRNKDTGAGYTLCVLGKAVRVSISATPNEKDNRHILVHELTHCVTAHLPKRGAHGDEYYKTFWDLAKRYKIDLDYALEREARYKVRSSMRMAKIAGIPGAFKAERQEKSRRKSIRETQKRLQGWQVLEPSGMFGPLTLMTVIGGRPSTAIARYGRSQTVSSPPRGRQTPKGRTGTT